MDENKKEPTTWTEEIEMKGTEIVGKLKELVKEAGVRRIVIRKPDGQTLIEVPVLAGASVAGVLARAAPVLAGIGAMAALVSSFKVEVIRDKGDETTAFRRMIRQNRDVGELGRLESAW